ncbi:MAG: hypothetical protein ACXVCX_07785 [Ktedonobacterales bacterium]
MFDDIFHWLSHPMPEDQAAGSFAVHDSPYGVHAQHDPWAVQAAADPSANHFDGANWHHPFAPAHPHAATATLPYQPDAAAYWSLGMPVPYHTDWNPATVHGVGNPVGESAHWHQQHENDCAVMAQADVYESITGRHLTEQEALSIVTQHGWYHDGTTLPDTGKLLNYLGIPTRQYTNASLQDLYTALQHGDHVIVGVNANEIWFPHHDSATGAPIEQSVGGHAVWVTGIDQAPDGSIKVILNDTGKPGGQMEAVDASDFMNAWSDFNNFMVVAPATHAAN